MINTAAQDMLYAFIYNNKHFEHLKIINHVSPSQNLNLKDPSGLTVGDYYKENLIKK